MMYRIPATGSAAILVLWLSACEAPVGPLPMPPEPGSETCGADQLQFLVGQPARVLASMRAEGKIAGSTRILRPGDAMTMDFSPQRLNIEIDPKERISEVRCG